SPRLGRDIGHTDPLLGTVHTRILVRHRNLLPVNASCAPRRTLVTSGNGAHAGQMVSAGGVGESATVPLITVSVGHSMVGLRCVPVLFTYTASLRWIPSVSDSASMRRT